MIRFSLLAWLISVVLGSILAWPLTAIFLSNTGDFLSGSFVLFLYLMASFLLSIPAAVLFAILNTFWWKGNKNEREFRVRSALTAIVITLAIFIFFSGGNILLGEDKEALIFAICYGSTLVVAIFWLELPEHAASQKSPKIDLLDNDF